LDKLTREQMVAELGDTGVQNPAVIDLITLDKASDTVVLVMTERRAWGVAEQLAQLEEKLNRYMGYVLDGFLAEQYPQYLGKSVRIRLDCVEAPHGEAVRFVEAMTDACERHGLPFALTLPPPLS
jgi:translation initiation factor RLI1